MTSGQAAKIADRSAEAWRASAGPAGATARPSPDRGAHRRLEKGPADVHGAVDAVEELVPIGSPPKSAMCAAGSPSRYSIAKLAPRSTTVS
jgi:hypothetical protein